MSSEIEKVLTALNVATRYIGVDLESDDVREQFQCPVCLEVPMDEIFQCPNGHIVCKTCCQNQCAQCRSPMKFPGIPGTGSTEDFYIRNRALENFLDSVLLFCPFRKEGCFENISGRANLKAHVQKCNYDGECIQLCNRLRYECRNWARTTKPLEIVEHLRSIHGGLTFDKPEFSIDLTNASNILTTVPVKHATPYPAWAPVHISVFNGHFLIANLFCKADCTLRCVGLRIDKQPEKEEVQTEIEVKICSKNAEVSDLVWRMPAISILKAATVLKHLPLLAPATTLRNYYLEDNDKLIMHIAVTQQKKSVKRKAPEN